MQCMNLKQFSSTPVGVLLAFLALSAVSLPLHAVQQVSRFCPECADSSTASQKATTFSPPVHCDWPSGSPELPIPDDLVCHSTDVDVLLINPLTGALFPYQLRFEPLINSHVLQTRTMSPEEHEAAQITVEIYQELITTEFGGHSTMQGHIQSGNFGVLDDSTECPDGTALDHVLNPELRAWMIDELRTPWFRILGQFNRGNVGVTRTTGISASVGLVTLSVGWSSSPPPVDDVFLAGFRFDVSEVPINSVVNSDFIAFRINDVRMMNLTLLMDSEFAPELSRAAGAAVNDLLSGQTVIDNECVIEKLAEHEQNNPGLEFRVGGPGGPLFDFENTPGGGGGGDNPDLCTKRLCLTVCVDGNCRCQLEVVILTFCDF